MSHPPLAIHESEAFKMDDISLTPSKKCTICERDLLCTKEFYRTHPTGLYGFRSICKDCQIKRAREKRNTVEEKAKIKQRESTPEYRAYRREYMRQRRQDPSFREQARIRALEYSRRPEVIAKNKERYNDPSVKKVIRSRQREYQRRDYVKEKNKKYAERDTRKSYIQRYRKTEKGHSLLAIGRVKRRTREAEIPFCFSKDDWNKCLRWWDYRCCICGKTVGLWHTIAIEHWIPVSDKRPDNPGTVPWNIVPMCHARPGMPAGKSCCNNSKSSHDPETWLAKRVGKRKAKRVLKRVYEYFEWTKQ